MATAADEVTGPRKGARKRVLMKGTLFTPDGAYVVWIRDISTSGALVSCKDRLPTECDVIFKRGPIFAAAQIAWANDTGAGVKFYRDLSEDAVATAAMPIPHAGE
jgi:PilZ domain